jgi:hypothetical protein
MGNLKPGATYVYERDGNTVYARESGADPSTRFEVGYEYDPINGHKIDYDSRTPDGRPLHEHLKEADLWGKIRRAAETNPTIRDALERAKIAYYLSKEYEESHGRKT